MYRCMHIYFDMFMYIYIIMNIYIYTHIYLSMYICIYIHICIHWAPGPRSVTLYEVHPPNPTLLTRQGYLAHKKPPPM